MRSLCLHRLAPTRVSAPTTLGATDPYARLADGEKEQVRGGRSGRLGGIERSLDLKPTVPSAPTLTDAIPLLSLHEEKGAGPEKGPAASPLPLRGLRASAWTLFGFAAAQILRLGGNLLLTRLLFREAFGLMALVSTVLQGLVMFSDLGLGPSIIQSKRGHERDFLNTAWTIQVGRGFVLLLASLALGWPAARFYAQPELLYLLPAVGLNALLGGFSSTSLYTLNRRLEQRKLVLLEATTQVVSLVVMAGWAWLHPTVWALAGGGIAGAAVRMVATHLYLADHPDRLQWEVRAAREIVSFGRWVFISSILYFSASKLDALILGRLLDIKDLGTYLIASNLARLPVEVVLALSSAVVFPILSESFRRNDGSLNRNLFRVRAMLILPTAALAVGLAVLGDRLVRLLYDVRYHDAGWMVRVLSAGNVATAVGALSGSTLLAVGNSRRAMFLEGARVLLLLGGMIVGNQLLGKPGLIIGVAAVGLLSYPVCALALHRERLWQPKLDLPVMLVAYGLLAGEYFVFG